MLCFAIRRAPIHAVMCVVTVLLMTALPLLAQAPTAPHSPVRDEFALLGRAATHAVVAPLRWDETQLRTAGRLLVGLAALSSLDASGRAFMRDHRARHWDALSLHAERLGTVQNYAVLGGFYAAGLLMNDRKARDVAVEAIASSIVAGVLITPTLQFVLGRSRPRRDEGVHTFRAFSGNISLPSGHTTQAFAVASVIAAEYDHVGVQILAYGLAGTVAAARMYHDAHFLSDVTAAAIIGTVVGRSVAGVGRARRERLRVEAAPDSEGGYQMRLTLPIR